MEQRTFLALVSGGLLALQVRSRSRRQPRTCSPGHASLLAGTVRTIKRDYIHGAELRDAESMLAQLAGWFDDYNRRVPHSALGMRPRPNTERRQNSLPHPSRTLVDLGPRSPPPRGISSTYRMRRRSPDRGG